LGFLGEILQTQPQTKDGCPNPSKKKLTDLTQVNFFDLDPSLLFKPNKQNFDFFGDSDKNMANHGNDYRSCKR